MCIRDSYNNERYQWNLAKLSPNEYYQFYMTGEYPLKVSNPPPVPKAIKKPSELGKQFTTDSVENQTETELKNNTLTST